MVGSTSTIENDTDGRLPDDSSQVSVLAVGDWERSEFAAAVELIDLNCWKQVDDVNAVCDLLANEITPPELILLAQSIPGEYRQSDLDRLGDLAPLSRVVVVAGTWCEGEMRTGSRLDGTLRLYWYEFAPWWQGAQRSLAAGLCPPWSLPLDNPQAGRNISMDCRCKISGSIAIDAADFAVYETLAAALAEVGAAACWARQADRVELPQDTVAGIWDGGQLGEAELAGLAAFCRKVSACQDSTTQGKVVALVDFPRVEHLRKAKAAGAAAVFAKPYVVNEVIAALC